MASDAATLPWHQKPIIKVQLSAGRRQIAQRRLAKKKPFPFKAELLGTNGMTVLVHKSTKKPGWWQATFFGRDGEPWSDSENKSWPKLLEHIHGDSVD